MRNFSRKSALMAVIAAGFFLPASYAAGSGNAKTEGAQSLDPMIQQMDTNGDNKISEQEYNTELDRRFKALDTNADGYLENGELRAARTKARKRKQQMNGSGTEQTGQND